MPGLFRKGVLKKPEKELFMESNGGVVLIMRPFRIFSFYFPYVLRLFRKYARTPVLIIPRDDSLYVPCH